MLYQLLSFPGDDFATLLDAHSLAEVDPELGATVSKISALVESRDSIQADDALGDDERASAIQALLFDGATLESLELTFTYPALALPLRPGGADELLTIENAHDWAALVVAFSVGSGVAKQVGALRSAFDAIVPLDALSFFRPAELEQMMCGDSAPWALEELWESTKADHGYTPTSPCVGWLLECMAEFDADQRATFLRFVTGSPRLPLGGIGALQPALTVVRSTIDGVETQDDALPSVMTCVNYIKLPPFSTKAVLLRQLTTAITLGAGHFGLS